MAFFKKTHAHNACTSNGVCIFLVLHITPPFGMGCGIARGASSAKRKEKEKRKKYPKNKKVLGRFIIATEISGTEGDMKLLYTNLEEMVEFFGCTEVGN